MKQDDSPSRLQKTFMKAIAEQRLVEVWHEGHRRVVEPHTLFKDQAGRVILNCWQVEGFSASGTAPWWRNLALDALSSAKMLPQRFSRPRPDYQAQSAQFATVIAELAPEE